MQSFKDTAGRTWEVALDVTALRRVRNLTNVDLRAVGAGDAKVTQQLVADPLVLVDVLYAVCKPEADQRSLTDEDFGRAFAGDVLDAALDALLEAIADFFPTGRRKLLSASWRKMRDGQSKAEALGLADVDKIDLDELIRRVWSESSTSSPDASASTPAPSPSAP